MEISTNAEYLLRRFDDLPKAVQTGVGAGLKRALLLTEDRVRRNAQLKWRRGGAGLAGRLTSSVTETAGFGLDGQIGFRKTRGFPYELSQEFGAKAKPGKAMAIPITPQAKRYGPREFPGKLFIPKGRHVLAVFRPRLKAIEPQYVLVKSIKPRLGFRATVLAALGMISDEIEAGAKAQT